MRVYDCVIYLDEDLLLDLRFNILNNFVDYFVVVESNKTWQNNKKKFNFNINNFKSFDLLLIDTEGYDCQIVNDFFLKIKKIRPIIIFEWSHIKNSEMEDTLYIIIKNNYSFFPIGDDVFCYPSEKDISLKLN